jgi:hypothetical protein
METEESSMSMHVSGALHVTEVEGIRREIAEAHVMELIEALADALVGAPHWRHQAQELLRRLSERPR